MKKKAKDADAAPRSVRAGAISGTIRPTAADDDKGLPADQHDRKADNEADVASARAQTERSTEPLGTAPGGSGFSTETVGRLDGTDLPNGGLSHDRRDDGVRARPPHHTPDLRDVPEREAELTPDELTDRGLQDPDDVKVGQSYASPGVGGGPVVRAPKGKIGPKDAPPPPA